MRSAIGLLLSAVLAGHASAYDADDNGAFKAQVAPGNDAIAFADDGSNYGEGCQVRMQRIGAWLLVVDNGGCGGAGVSFTELYRRKT